MIAYKPNSLKYQVYLLFREIKRTLVNRPKHLVRLTGGGKKFLQSKSYYPEAPYHRSKLGIFTDQIINIIRYGAVNEFYYSWGFDTLSHNEQKKYVDYAPFMFRRELLNYQSKHNNSCVLRNKILFNLFANGLGVRTPRNLYFIDNNSIWDFVGNKRLPFSLDFVVEGLRYFVKVLDGECGYNVFVLSKVGGQYYLNNEEKPVAEVRKILSSAQFLVQDVVSQHHVLSSLHPQSINTIRLVTVRHRRTNQIKEMAGELRIGVKGHTVDNAAQGGVCVGIDLVKGSLRQWGIQKQPYGTKTESHPDTGVRYLDLEIPYLREGIEQAKKLHSFLPETHSIGWDIAITEDGPLFIEGNDNWEITGIQMTNGGQKAFFDEYFY